ncbi:nucleotidyltransferase domain-containing protein, partial [Candidatus Woesearchaeota archaeon]|nr:nucleotidyltransferase domain-containing protein [Candidatus Woesearchaeota archaeon]
MDKQTLKAIAYVQNALSFIFLQNDIRDKVNSIYLYGSAVRGELLKESDIDVFIDCDPSYENNVKAISNSSLSKFYVSDDYKKWEILRFTNNISIEAGEFMRWELKTSILAEGILLYSKKPEILPATRKVLFTFQLPKKKKIYFNLTRALYGRKEKGYKEHGFLKEANGHKIASNVIIVPK